MPSLPTLLLADDSLTIQRVMSLTFADQPVRLVVAKDGQDAINRMAKERPDLVLADTNMPCVDGYELARWVREQPHLSTVPVLLLAGVADPVDEQRLHDSGANGVLEKPFEPSHVISRVKELLGLKGTAPAPAGGRLVTAPSVTGAAAPNKAGAQSRPADSAAPDRSAPPSHESVRDIPALSGAKPDVLSTASAVPPPAHAAGPDASEDAPPPFDLHVPPGDSRDWFGDAAEGASPGSSVASLAEELGLSPLAFDGTVDQRHATIETNRAAALASASGVELRQPHTPGSAADVFESLLAAEQGHAPPPVLAPAPADLSPAVLDDLASRVAERLRPAAERMGTDLRGALAEAVQAAVSGTIPGGVRDAVNESVAAAIRDAVVPVVRDSVRDAVETAVRGALPEALARVVPGAVIDAVGGDGGGDVRALVRETAERLITEEIARIRQPRG